MQQLRFLTALAGTLNFSRAAELVFVTQPTLSSGIKELEERLGVALVERTRHSVLFTPIGLEIVERAKDLLGRAGEIESLARSHANPEEGKFTLGSIPTVGPYLVPAALPVIRKCFPDLSLYLREEMTESLVDGVSSGRLDMALIALPFDIANLEYAELFNDGYQLAIAKSRNKKAARQVRDSIFSGRSLMLLETGHCLQRHALAAFPEQDLSLDESFAATSLATLVAMVSEGLGVTLLPELAIKAGLAENAQIDLVPLPDACPRTVVLAWRKTSPHKQLFRTIAQILKGAQSAV
ncbi:hydrogen peroxide-inducible genes activator [Granulosicoccus antarcticus]|uniref:hydrogen peroxide-inducible genes activator n=1 Tax=Granulosicoccus antarcticus TaxID=437505 RepID=UPI00197AEDAF|nr:hydrogen peroxide-inducible genes activator [Granulosicoccus antarcticus]